MKLDRIHAFEIFGNQHWVQRWKGNNYLEMPREVILNNWKVLCEEVLAGHLSKKLAHSSWSYPFTRRKVGTDTLR